MAWKTDFFLRNKKCRGFYHNYTEWIMNQNIYPKKYRSISKDYFLPGNIKIKAEAIPAIIEIATPIVGTTADTIKARKNQARVSNTRLRRSVRSASS